MKAFKVGGAVRDRLLGLSVKDTDWVVIGSSIEEMIDKGFTPVGADFPVFLHPETGDEYALARTERKTGVGYGGFTFHIGAGVTLEEDLSRRDLTINAMAEDDQGEVVDPYGGRADLQAKRLRHVSSAFAEDPLRVLRVARFAARFAPQGFTVAPETLALMKDLVDSGELGALKAERVWKEVSRALLEERADVFFLTLRACGALQTLFPELDALFGVVQPALHHPEIDTGVHTLMVLQQACRFRQPLAVRWAVLCHDFGKALSPVETLPAHHGHEKSGLSLVQAASERFRVPSDCASLAQIVCEYHTHMHRAFELKASTLLELLERSDAFRRPERLDQFVAACEMDSRGRLGFENRDYPQAGYVRGAADVARAVQAMEFVEQGLQGPAVGEAIRRKRLRVLKRHIQEFQSAVSRESSA